MADIPKAGRYYKVIHSRKGTFWMKITWASEDGDAVEGIITKGNASAIMSYNQREKGDEIRLANNNLLALFYECSEQEALEES